MKFKLIQVLVKYNKVKAGSGGAAYSETLMGSMLNLSCLAKNADGSVEYFEKPLEGALSTLEGNLWTATHELCDRIHSLFSILLRDPVSRDAVLDWIAGCLDSNLPRGKLWATTGFGLPGALGYIGDGFAINLASVLLRLCR